MTTPPLSSALQDVVYQTAAGYNVPSVTSEILARTATPSVFFAPQSATTAPTGHHVGGLPDAPPSFEWPDALSFLAQINLGALPVSVHPDLPEEGVLHFFFDSDKQEDGACTGRHRRGAIEWHAPSATPLCPAIAPTGLTQRPQDGLFARRALTPFPGISIPPADGYPLEPARLEVGSAEWNAHGQLAADLRRMAAPPHSADALLHSSGIAEAGWLQLGGHVRYFRDGTGYDYRLGAVLEKHGLVRDFAWGTERIQEQIAMYSDTLPDWCFIVKLKTEIYTKHRQAFIEEAQDWVLLLQIPTLNALGMVWGDDHTVSFLLDKTDLKSKRFDQAWVMCHP